MLMLTRYAGERVYIGPDIYVEVVRGHNVKLGIHAPKELRILREELFEQAPPETAPETAPAAKPEQIPAA